MSPAVRRLALPVFVFVAGALALIVAAFLAFSPQQQAGAGIGGPFKLEGANGRIVQPSDFAGQPFLVFFGYTHCPDVCPTALFEISEVLRALGEDKKISALFITVDPERDTAKIVSDYVSSFDKRIIGLSGPRADIDAVIKAFRVYARKVPDEKGGPDYAMDHTALVYLMDKKGRFVGAFNMSRPPAEAAKDLAKYL